MLVLCAIGPLGDSFWEASNRLFAVGNQPEAHEVNQLCFSADELFPANTEGKMPDGQTLASQMRRRLPPVRMDTLTVGVAVSATEPCVAERLSVLLSAFEGISQIPALLHLFVLGPDAFIQFGGDLMPLLDLFRIPSKHRLHCSDICWVRLGGEPKSIDPVPISDSRLRAASHLLHSMDAEAHRFTAFLQSLETSLRDSLSCRLLFDRPRWENYATADLTVRLASVATTPTHHDLATSGMTWVREVVFPAISLAAPAHSQSTHLVRRPVSLLQPREAQDWSEPVSALRREAETRFREESKALATRLKEPLGKTLLVAREEVANRAPNALQSLADVAAWATGVKTEMNGVEASPPKMALLSTWLRAASDLLDPILRLPTEAFGFDLAMADSWPDTLATLRDAIFRDSTGGGETPLRRCASYWIDQLLPALIPAWNPEADPVEIVLNPVSEVLNELGEQLEALFAKAEEERKAIEAQYRTPEGMVAKAMHRLFRVRKLKKALMAWDRQHLSAADRIYELIESVLNLASQWLSIASRHKALDATEHFMRTKIGDTLNPVLALWNQFAEAIAGSTLALELTPVDAPNTEDLLSLPDRTRMAVMVAEIDPRASDWLDRSRNELPEDKRRSWMHVAGACFASLPDWAGECARSLPVDLANFLIERFPETVEPSISRLLEMASALLLPLKRQNADRRRIHQEWHLPPVDALCRHTVFENCIVSDELVSTAPTSCARLVSPAPDWLEIHLHALGFRPEDYIHWRLFGDSEKSSSLGPIEVRIPPSSLQ